MRVFSWKMTFRRNHHIFYHHHGQFTFHYTKIWTYSTSSSVIMKKPWNSLLLSFCQQLNGEKYYCRNYVLHSFMQNTAIHGIPFVLKVVQVMTTASLLFPEIFLKKKSRIQFQREDICFSNPFSSNKLSLTFTTISIAMQTLFNSLLLTSYIQKRLSIEFKSGRSQDHPENETKPAWGFHVFIWKCILTWSSIPQQHIKQ